jgi:hypothetical protein
LRSGRIPKEALTQAEKLRASGGKNKRHVEEPSKYTFVSFISVVLSNYPYFPSQLSAQCENENQVVGHKFDTIVAS